MSREVKHDRGLLRPLIAMIMLLAGGAAILWAKIRPDPDPLATAITAYSRGEWDRAGSLASRRLKEVPDEARALRLAARAAARQDQDRKAIAIYTRLVGVAMDPEDCFLLGRALVRAGQIESAFEAFQAALEKDPDHPEALAALSALYVRTDRFYAAAALAERLARQPASEARAQMILGKIRAEVNDSVGAARALRRALQLDPDGRTVAAIPVAETRKLLARSLLKSGQPAEARTVVEPLLAAGSDPEASWLLSRCFIQQGDWDRAAALLKEHPYRAAHPLDPEPAPYVGEARCAECHREQFDAVLASRHATTFARAHELESLPLPQGPFADPGNPQVTHQLRRDGHSLVAETRANQTVRRAVIDYAFGSRDHFTTFVGRDDQGRSTMVRMSYYRSPRGTGWDVATGLPRRPPDQEGYLGKTMFPEDGVRRCVSCHTTNVHSILHEAGPDSADHSIGCERCHGPGGHHVAAVAAGSSDLAIVSPGRAPPAAIDQICAKCHGTEQPPGVDLPRTDPLWLRFQSLTLTWSRCYTDSDRALGCVTCHDPHRNAETSAVRNEAKCLSCHSADPTSKAVGTKKLCSVNPSRGCIDCHMPRIWVQSTHSFKTDHFIRVRDQSAPTESEAQAVH